jgi:oxygen-independent coproporphyrinogen-3 oxidase
VSLSPDSVTIYQMELPFNAVYSQAVQTGDLKVADWKTKRDWVDYAFREMERQGYHISSAYTVVKSPQTRFVYRDSVWHGSDMVGTGVASFSHVGGVHYQNLDGFEEYARRLEEGHLPLSRALPVGPRELLIREVILQLKLGRLEGKYFQEKFGVDIEAEFGDAFEELRRDHLLENSSDGITLTRSALLRVDGLLPLFFEPAHRGARYT